MGINVRREKGKEEKERLRKEPEFFLFPPSLFLFSLIF
jgi:hypothetical protein